MRPDHDEDDQDHRPTDSATVGLMREFMRSMGNLGGRGEGDQLAEEIDRVAESITGPNTTAEDVDAVFNTFVNGLFQQRQPRGAAPVPVAVRTWGDQPGRYELVVDLPPAAVTVEQSERGVRLITPEGESEIPFPSPVRELLWQSEPTATMSVILVETAEADEDDAPGSYLPAETIPVDVQEDEDEDEPVDPDPEDVEEEAEDEPDQESAEDAEE